MKTTKKETSIIFKDDMMILKGRAICGFISKGKKKKKFVHQNKHNSHNFLPFQMMTIYLMMTISPN